MEGVRKYFFFIKKKVSSDWGDLAFFLGFPQAAINNIAGRNPDDNSRCMDLLEEWLKQNGERATIEVLMKALSDAELQSTVDELKKKYPELRCSGPTAVLPVYLQLAPQTSADGDISKELSARILELERTLFTVDVLRDPKRYEETRKIFLSHKALLKDAVKGSFLLLLTFLRQTDVDRFYHNHYRVGEGTLSQQLSHILISDDLQDKVKGAKLIVRLQVKHEDYVRVRDRLGQGLDRTTSMDNLLALPPPSRHVDHSSLSALDLAVIGQEDQSCTDGTDDVSELNFTVRQVQGVVQIGKEKSKQEVKVQLEMMQGQVETGRIGVDVMMREVKMLREKNEKAEKILLEQKAETNKKIQQLQETNKSLEARIEELLTAKEPVGRGQVKQSVVQGFRSTGVEWRWVKKVGFVYGKLGRVRGKCIYPFVVAVSKDNEVYITDYSNSRIKVFTMDGVYTREFTTTLPGETGKKLKPWDVAVDRNDNLWVMGESHVVQYSREGTCLATMKLPFTGFFSKHAITVAMATEQVIVTGYDYGNNGQLVVFNQNGTKVGTYGSGHRSPEPWHPQYVTVDGEGNILVTDGNNHCVHVFDKEGNFRFKFGSKGSYENQFKNPEGICVDGMGNIIVADSGNHCVKMFDSQGRFLCYISSEMQTPIGVTVSPGGDVVVTEFNDDTVSVWTQG